MGDGYRRSDINGKSIWVSMWDMCYRYGIYCHSVVHMTLPTLAPHGSGLSPMEKPRRAALEQGLTLVPISAQLELNRPLFAQPKLTLSPTYPILTR